MGQSLPTADALEAISKLREALAVIDDSEGRLPLSVTNPYKAADYVREDDTTTARTMLDEARSNEQAAEKKVHDLITELEALPMHSPEREEKRLEAMEACEVFFLTQNIVTTTRDHYNVVMDAFQRKQEFAPHAK